MIGPIQGISTISTIQAHFGSPRTLSSSVWMQSASAKIAMATERMAGIARNMGEV